MQEFNPGRIRGEKPIHYEKYMQRKGLWLLRCFYRARDKFLI